MIGVYSKKVIQVDSMNTMLKNLPQKLTDLGKKAEEFDKLLTNLRIEINDALWDLMELRKSRMAKKAKDKLPSLSSMGNFG